MRNIFTLAMTGKEFQRWKSSRKRGELFHILVWGVLYFGGAMFVFDVCRHVFVEHKLLSSSVDGLQIVGNIAVGLFFGFLTWNSNESRFQKALMRESSTNGIPPE